MKDRINRSHSKYDIPIIRIGQASEEELKALCEEVSDASVSDRWLKTYSQSSGFCAGYCVEKMFASRKISGRLWVAGKKELCLFNNEMELEIPVGMYKRNRDLSAHEVSAGKLGIHELDGSPLISLLRCYLLCLSNGRTLLDSKRYCYEVYSSV